MKIRHHAILWATALLAVSLASSLTYAQGPAQGVEDVTTPQAALGTGFTYQGQLTRSGVLVDTTCDFRFRLYDAQSGGSQIGSAREIPGVSVSDGLFTVVLDFGSSAFAGQARWLEAEVRCPPETGYTVLDPRQALTATPYALYALKVGSHNHLGQTWSGSDNALVINGSFSDSPNNAPLVLSNSHASSDGLRVMSAGRDGVYVGSADYGLHVGSADADGVYVAGADGDGLSVGSVGDAGLSVYAAANDGVFVRKAGNASSTSPNGSRNGVEVAGAEGSGLFVGRADGAGVYVASANEGVQVDDAFNHGLRVDNAGLDGVYVTSAGDDGVHVGRAGSPSIVSSTSLHNGLEVAGAEANGLHVGRADGDGIYIESAGNDGLCVDAAGGDGVQVRWAASDGVDVAAARDGVKVSAGLDGVYVSAEYDALNVSSAGRHGVYVHYAGSDGIHVRSAESDGIYVGAAHGSWAGYFNGSVYATYFSGPGAAATIDHPLNPQDQYLSHALVGSPEMMNIYNGNVRLDENGEAWVDLPDWFEALNGDFRYQLTAIGGPGPSLYIAQEVQDNRFQIAGGAPQLLVSWQVTGIRQDPFALANPVPVEREKPERESGTYLNPAAYDMPETMGLAYQKSLMQVDHE